MPRFRTASAVGVAGARARALAGSSQMSEAPISGRAGWPGLTAVAPIVLGTFGWFSYRFGLGSDCTDKFDCAAGHCRVCDSMIRWVDAAGIGQWILVAVAGLLFVLCRRHPRWHQFGVRGAWAILPISIAWFAVAIGIAEHSF